MESPLPRKQFKKSIKSKARPRANAGSSRPGDTGDYGPDGKMVIFSNRFTDKRVTRTFGIDGTVSSTGAGLITLAAISGINLITALGSEFTNFSQEFQEFRVKRIRSHFLPSTTSATSTTGPYQGAMIVAPWKQFVPTTLSTLEQGAQKEIFSTLQETKVQCSSAGFPNAMLWTATSSAIVADRDFGIAYTLLPASPIAVSSRIFSLYHEMVIEFRIAQ